MLSFVLIAVPFVYGGRRGGPRGIERSARSGLRRTRAESTGAQPTTPAPRALSLSVEAVANWAVTNSQWPVTMGLACCAIEMMSFGTPRSTPRASAWRARALPRARPTS